jgi:cell wall-associated NlpC family hydrolase
MTGPTLDRRRNAFRPDLADGRLEGQVSAERFTSGVQKQVRQTAIPLRRAPDAMLGLDNEVLLGEVVTVFDEADGWAWAQLQRDGYVGYVPAAALSQEILTPTHRVQAPATFIYSQPDIKLTPLAQLSLNAVVTVTGLSDDARFAALATGGFVYGRHLAPIGDFAGDFVEVAEQLIHTPYLWGGRTRAGLDCSALVQLSLEAAGLPCPRDSDMAAADIGKPLPVPADLEGLSRGDLVFWTGHCGLMIDSVMLLHANGYHMATVIEPLSQVVRRYRKAGGGTNDDGLTITTIRRLARAGAAAT